MFIESICTDSQVLEQNYRYKMKYSPDYKGVDTEAVRTGTGGGGAVGRGGGDRGHEKERDWREVEGRRDCSTWGTRQGTRGVVGSVSWRGGEMSDGAMH